MSSALLADGMDDPPNVGTCSTAATPKGDYANTRASWLNFQPPVYLPQPLSIPPPTLAHHTQTILSLLLSLKKKPVIRWEKMSSGGKKLAQDVNVSTRWRAVIVRDTWLIMRGKYGRLL